MKPGAASGGDPTFRGPLMTAKQIVEEFFPGTRITSVWVSRNLPGKIRLGHKAVLWRRDAVVA